MQRIYETVALTSPVYRSDGGLAMPVSRDKRTHTVLNPANPQPVPETPSLGYVDFKKRLAQPVGYRPRKERLT